VGATAVAEYMPGGSWDGNYHLSFPATATGQSFTLSMENDRWEETDFDGPGAICEDAFVEFDGTLTPKDFVIHMPGSTNTWQVDWQTLNTSGGVSMYGNELTNCAVRILVRGAQLDDGGAILHNGPLHCLWFYASWWGDLKIQKAFIARRRI